MNEILKLIISIKPVTKKNSQDIFINKKTGKPFITQNKRYKEYEKAFNNYIKDNIKLEATQRLINTPINIKAFYYMPTRRKVDLNNLHSALSDCLVNAEILKDDNYTILVSWDGSRVKYDKNNPRTEILITKQEN